MNRRLTGSLLGLFAAGAIGVGCQHASCQKACTPEIPARYGPYAFMPPPVDHGVPSAPLGAQAGFQYPPPLAPAPQTRSYQPPPAQVQQPEWRPPANNGVRLQAPETEPVSPPPSRLPQGPDSKAPQTLKPDDAQKSPGASPFPVGIAHFALARDQVASGLAPIPEGYDWLKDNSYRTVLHIKQPGEDDTADRRQIEQRGMKFASLEFSPDTVVKSLDDFNRLLGDAGSLPLFVYDKDASLAGPLWYLHFRSVDKLEDEPARTKATSLGLKTDKDSENQPLWLAIQKYLSEQIK